MGFESLCLAITVIILKVSLKECMCVRRDKFYSRHIYDESICSVSLGLIVKSLVYNWRFRLVGVAGRARADDQWSTLNRHRSTLLTQVDAGKLVPLLRGKVLSPSQETAILREREPERRTAMLLDWLETKKADDYNTFVEAVGELYPHIYLELTGSGQDDDGRSTVNDTGIAHHLVEIYIYFLGLRLVSSFP